MIFWYALFAIVLFLFSYTQVDLNLTISESTIFQTIQKAFQYIGFYQRPITTYWFLGILVWFYGLYAVTLHLIQKGTLTAKELWKIVLFLTAILLFSYPAFSYDMFNYMFTAKTILVYHKNPYVVIPLQFSGVEPWLSFMRWTHLPSAYTPLWIVFTLPMYLSGLGYFLTTLWSIKALAAAGYVGTVWFVGKILAKTDPKHSALGMGIVALNPLMIIESLVSGHNDVVMMVFAMMSVYALVHGRKLTSFFLMSVATAAKFMTIFLLPVMAFGYRPMLFLAAMIVGFILVVLQREILPWYFVWLIPFIALLPRSRLLLIISSAFSLGLLLRYAPYFYLGHWNDPVPTIKLWVTLVPPVLASIFLLLRKRV